MRVSYKSNVAQLRALNTLRMKRLLPALQRSEERSGRIIAARARMLSQGPLSSATLRALGHPYAMRDPRPPLDPAMVNRQTGRFLSSWKYQTELSGNMVSLFVYNDAPWAKYMLGTRKMIARPILKKLVELEAPARFERLRRAFGKVVQA